MNQSSRSHRTTILLSTIFVVSSGVAIAALRHNSRRSQELYEALLEADQSGENVEAALDDLRSYIYSHMNTEIGSENGIHPPIQLQGTYNRLIAKEQERIKKANDSVYERAQEICEAQFGAGSLRNGRVQCVERYIEENSVQESTSVSPDLYRFDFVAPLWSPDIAGYSLLVSGTLGVFLLLKVVKTIVRRVLES